jgi:FkbM family methyltransferase
MLSCILKNLLSHYYLASGRFGRLHGIARSMLYRHPLLVHLCNKYLLQPSLPNEDLVLSWDDQLILLENPRHNVISQEIFLKGVWEPAVTEYVCPRIKPGMTVIDVGADTGYYTLLFARRVGRVGKVIAFEPIPSARETLERNISLNDYTNITVCDFALFSSNSLMVLEAPRELSRIDPRKTKNEKTGIQIQTKSFDECVSQLNIQRIDLVKIDVEGAELDVLYGMRHSLEKYHPALLVEVHSHYLTHFGYTTEDLGGFLDDMKYGLHPVDKPSLDLRNGNTTIYCH